jgi:hypothetical protein
MRYLVKGRLKDAKEAPLLRSIKEGTLGKGSVAGDEYIHNMNQARVDDNGVATWVEVCYCNTPLQEERPYWEEFFELTSVKDAHARKNCRHENGSEKWACSNCDCTKKLEEKLSKSGQPFLETLRQKSEKN